MNGNMGISAQNQPTALFNAMVSPVINFAVKGFCWYQGESNTGHPQEYTKLLPALINDWRNQWKLKQLLHHLHQSHLLPEPLLPPIQGLALKPAMFMPGLESTMHLLE
jgi:hypothetical protein